MALTGKRLDFPSPPRKKAPLGAWPTFERKLAETLGALEEDQYLVVSAKRGWAYVQFAAQGSYGLRAECMSNNYLDEAHKLRAGQTALLRRIGWSPPTGTPIDPAVERAARTHQVPAHVIAAELELGVVADAGSAAAGLAAAQRRHPGDLQAALADALGDGSLAAAVLRQGSGPGLEGAGGTVRLLPVGDQPSTPLPVSRMHVAPLPPSPDPAGGGRSMTRLIGDVAAGAQNVAGHIEETGGEVTFQGAAGLKSFGRAGLMALSAFLPRAWERDAASAAGSAWDAGSPGGYSTG